MVNHLGAPCNLLSTQVPTPTIPTKVPLIAASTSKATSAPFQPGGFWSGLNGGFCAQNLNRLLAAISYIAKWGGTGFGVSDGLTILSISGLTYQIQQGHASNGGPIEFTGAGWTPGMPIQDSEPLNTAPASDGTYFIWVDQAKNVYQTNTTGAPTVGPFNDPPVYIANIVVASGAITGVDYSGVAYNLGNRTVRFTNDTLAPADTPTGLARIDTITNGGTWEWDGVAHRQKVNGAQLLMNGNGVQFTGGHFQQSYAVQVLTGTLVLTASSPNIQHLSGSSSQVVALPANNTINLGSGFTIFNDNAAGSGNNYTVKDSTLTTTITTLAPQQFAVYTPQNPMGSPAWPSSVTAVSQNTTNVSVPTQVANHGQSPSGTIASTFLSGVAGGNLSIAIIGQIAASASNVTGVTNDKGDVYTLLDLTTLGGDVAVLAYRLNTTAGATTITAATTSTGGIAAAMISAEFPLSGEVLDKHTVATSTGTNALASGSTATLSQAVELVIGWGMAGGTSGTALSAPTPSTNFNQKNQSSLTICFSCLLSAATTAQSAAYTYNAVGVQKWVCGVATFTA